MEERTITCRVSHTDALLDLLHLVLIANREETAM